MNETFQSRCRACAGQQENLEKMVSLFGEKDVSEMFTNCTSLEVALHDCLPSHICYECFGNLTKFYRFRQSCVNSDKLLREQLITEPLKIEEIDDINIKQEVNEAIPDLESEFHEIKFANEDSSHSASDFMVKSPISTHTENSISHGDRDSVHNFVTANADDLDPFDSTKFICDICGQQFRIKRYMGSHMIKHKKEIEKSQATNIRCTVKGCAKSFTQTKLLNCHLKNYHKLESQEKPNKLSCHLCSKQFVMQYILDGHIREVHEGLKPYKCPHCEKEFSKTRTYKHHLQFRHSAPEKMHRCMYAECGKEYTLGESLNSHINRIHLGIFPKKLTQNYVCDQCGLVFKNGSKLKDHKYKHSGILPYACKTCPKSFATKKTLNNHTIRVHLKLKPFVCPTCGLRKTTNRELQAHLNFHSKEITYPCKECPRVFASYGAINRHVRIHHRNHKPYICPHCQRAFSKAETMKNHIMTHTGKFANMVTELAIFHS
ncbi:Zinc finger protein, partial [Pseudolycoriella hygida]